MDSVYNLQDLVRCDLCETPVPPLYCDTCHIYICKTCTADHILDESTHHKVVPVQRKGKSEFPLCPKHSTKQCELHCEQCDIPICIYCVSSDDHLGHRAADIMKTYNRTKEIIQKDLKELEISFLPRYQDIVYNIPVQKADVYRNSQELTKAINKRGDNLHKVINTIIGRKTSEIMEIEKKCLAVLQKQEYEVTNIISEITRCITDLNGIFVKGDIALALAYRSKNDRFRNFLPKFKVIYPSFSSQKIYEEQLLEQFGSLSVGAITTESGDLVEYLRVISPPSNGPSADQRHIKTSINTGYCCLYKGVCLNDKRIWTLGNNNFMKLYNSQGELLKSVQTKPWNIPSDIALTVSEDLVYTDYYDRSVNVIKENRIEKLIKLWRWRPLNVCSTFSGDLLVTLIRDDKKQSEIVRYSGSTDKQIIQFDDKGQPLFSPVHLGAITENKNLDICVIDIEAAAVVVVNHAGKLRFKYTGPASLSNMKHHLIQLESLQTTGAKS